ncbi:MAG: hypothetical protein ACRBBV_10630 [Paracoccaceae bacterium]
MPPAETIDAHTNNDAARENRRDAKIILAVLAGALLWGGAFLIWGVPGLYIPALAAVPVIWLLLILISRG